MTRQQLYDRIEAVLYEMDEAKRRQDWEVILTVLHEQVMAPSPGGVEGCKGCLHDAAGEWIATSQPVTVLHLWSQPFLLQAVFGPISSLVNVAIVNQRYQSFTFGTQQFDVPLHQIVDTEALGSAGGGSGSRALPGGAIAGIVIASLVAVAGVAFAAFLVARERRGSPLFVPLMSEEGVSAEMAVSGSGSGDGKPVSFTDVKPAPV
jgi:hypothetical protein